MRINNNISSMVTQGSLLKATVSMDKSIEKLSTGLRINRAADDAAGLGVSENLRTQVRGLGMALSNTQDAIAMLNIADGALNEQAEILQRMREVVIQAKNDTYSSTERAYMFQEFNGLRQELDRIAQVTNFNGMQLFATPDAVGTPIGNNTFPDMYEGNLPNGYNQNGLKSNHASSDARAIWTDDEKSIFGALDNSSANHFNMMVGANYTSDDGAAYDAATQSYGDRGAGNMVTVQFGQMDANSLLTLSPSADFAGYNMGTAADLWDNFDFDSTLTDMEDDALAESGAAPSFVEANSVGEKLNVLLKIIDGDGADFSLDFRSWWGNDGTGNVNVTGLERVNRMRSNIGAWTNRLEHSINATINQINNSQAAESLVRDVDFASETAKFSRNSILTSSATAMLSQANMTTQGMLQLLQ
jgi:flagellin